MDFKSFLKILLIKSIIYSISLFYGTLTCFNLIVNWIKVGNSFWYLKDRPVRPKCLDNPLYGKHSFVNFKDVKIHYVEKGDKSKPLMLFVHGFPEFWFSWRYQLKEFSKTHWTVALDLRGYGESEKPKAVSEYKMEKLIKDIYDLVKALGKEKCILVGHDWGGSISWCVAAFYPEIVEKLIILNSPHPGAYIQKVSKSLNQLLKSWYVFFFQIPYLPELYYRAQDLSALDRLYGASTKAEEMEACKYNWSQKGAWTPPINYYRNMLSVESLLNPKPLPKIEAQTLIIWGENDIALEKDLAEMSKAFLKDGKVEYIKEASHFVQHDRPAEVNRAIQAFVKS